MAIRFYDEALAEKIGKWIVSPDVKVLRPDESARLFAMKADEAKDMPITLPIVSLSRNPRMGITIAGKRPMSYDGLRLRALDKEGKEVALPRNFKLNAIPMSLQYQLDIYCRRLDEADEYMRNFVFNFVNYPKLVAEFKYNGVDFRHFSTVYLSDEVVDNSDIPERLFPDQFTRYTLGLTVDDAYLFSVPDGINWSISGVVVDIEGKPENETVAEFPIDPRKPGFRR